MMASRWAYEAMAVHQFKNNSYEEPYFDLEKIEAQTDFRASFLVDELDKRRKYIADNRNEKDAVIRNNVQKNLDVIQTTLKEEKYYKKGLEGLSLNTSWAAEHFTPEFDKKLEEYLSGFKKFYRSAYNRAVTEREKIIFAKESEKGAGYNLNEYKNKYHNESLADVVTNISEKERIIEFDGRLIQQINPIFVDPVPDGIFDYRAHFFAPKKNLLGTMVSTYWFNILVIWIMTIILYITLYFEVLRKFVNSFEKVPGKMSLPKVALSKKK
jgi:hypothetical protein